MASTFLVACLVYIFIPHTHTSRCVHDYTRRDFNCSIDAGSLVILHFKFNSTQFRFQSSSLYMKVVSRNYERRMETVYNCTRREVSGMFWVEVDCAVWNLAVSHKSNLYHKMYLIEIENKNKIVNIDQQNSKRSIVLGNRGKDPTILGKRDQNQAKIHRNSTLNRRGKDVISQRNNTNRYRNFNKNPNRNSSNENLLNERPFHKQTKLSKSLSTGIYRGTNTSDRARDVSTKYIFWTDPSRYRLRYTCQCEDYYRMTEVRGVASYDSITLQWVVPPWLTLESYIINCSSQYSKQNSEITPECRQTTCKTKIENLGQCTKYKVCLGFTEKGTTPTCIHIETKCVTPNTPIPVPGGGDSLRVEMKISLGAMGVILLAACLVVALTRLRRKPPRKVVEQELIEPRASTPSNNLLEEASLANGESSNGYCDVVEYVVLPESDTDLVHNEMCTDFVVMP